MKTLAAGLSGLALLAAQAAADPPVIQPIPDWTIDEDTMLTVEVTVTDGDSPTLVYWVEVDDTHLSVSFDELNMEVHVTPARDWNGTGHVTVGADDMDGGRTMVEETFAVVVTRVNDCPVYLDSTPRPPLTTPEDVCLDIPFSILQLSFRDIDWTWGGDTLSFQNPSYTIGTVENTATGWRLCAPSNFNGTGRLDYQATDGDCVINGRLNITVQAVNDCPVQIQPWDFQQGTEDQSLLVANLVQGWSDVEGSALGFAGFAGDDLGFTADWNAQTGSLSLHPAADWNGAAQLTLLVGDGACQVPAPLDLTLDAVNDAPRLQAPATLELDEDALLEAPFIITEVDGPELNVTVECSAPELAASWEAGLLRLEPQADWNGTATVTLSACDAFQGPEACSEAQVAVTVLPLNDAPVLEPLPDVALAEDSQLTVPVVVEDIDSQDLAITVASDQPDLTALWEPAQQRVRLTPAADWHGGAVITVSVDDQDGRAVDQASFAAVVTPVNDTPVLPTAQALELSEDGVLSVPFPVSDVDGPALAVTVESGEAALVAVWLLESGELSLTPAADWNGSALLTVTACDGADPEACVQTTVAVTVLPVNDAPVILPLADQAFPEDTPALVAVDLSDLDSSELLIGVTTDDSALTAVWQAADSRIVLTPAANWHGGAVVTLSVDDQDGRALATASFTATVTAVNDAPVLPDLPPQEMVEDNILLVAFPISDLDGPLLQVTASSSAPELVVAWLPESGELRLAPAVDWNGSALVTVTACDGDPQDEICVEAQLPVSVVAINDPPQVEPVADQTLVEDTPAWLPLVVHDVDSQDILLTVDADRGALEVSWDAAGSRLLLTPAADWNGITRVKLTLDDQGGRALGTLTFTTTVTPVNDAPVLPETAQLQLAEDVPLQLDYPVGDVDGPALTVSAACDTNAVTAVWQAQDGLLLVTPAADWSGTALLTVTACDGHEGGEACVQALIAVTVGAVNDAPVIEPLALQRLAEDSVVLVPVTISDLDNAQWTVGVASDQPGLAVSWLEEGQARLAPAANWHGSATVTVSVDDGEGRTVTETTFQVLVQPVNDAPHAAPCGEWSCGLVDDPVAFRQLLLNGGLLLDVADVDQDELTLTWFVDGEPVSSHRVSAGADTLHCWSLPAPPEEVLDGAIVLRAELGDGAITLNPGGADCAWELDFTGLGGAAPEHFTLGPGYPNPFNPSARLPFSLEQAGEMRLAVFDLRGAQVAVLVQGWQAAGVHEAVWNAGGQASGIYLAVLESGGRRLVERLTLLK